MKEKVQLSWAVDFAHSCGVSVKTIIKKHTSFELKYFAERQVKKISNYKAEYISKDALILANVDAGFSFIRKDDTPNTFFNVSE